MLLELYEGGNMLKKEDLKDYQIEALASIKKARMRGDNRALVVMATGVGKTAVCAFDIEHFLREEGGRCLLLCHSNEILRQDMNEIRSILGNKYRYGLFNCETKKINSRILFASIKSIYLRLDLFKADEFAYIVVDEAHHAPAGMYQKVLNYFQPKFLLGMTATPNRLDGMSLNLTFGQTIYSLELPEAIQKGILTSINYRLVLDELINLEKDPENGEIFNPKTDEEVAAMVLEKRQNSSMLVFCTSISHANKMHSLLPGSGIMHSGCSNEQNATTLKSFRKGELSTIVSVDMLNEGVDIPHADTIVFLRSTMSPVVYYQQLGRGLRRCPGKDSVTVYDFVGNVDRIKIVNELALSIKKWNNSETEKKGEKKFELHIEAKQFGNRNIELEFIIQKINEISRRISIKKEMIEEVRQFAEDLGGRPPTEEEYTHDVWINHNLETVLAQFENWDKFLKMAGFDIYTRKITRAEILKEFTILGQRAMQTKKLPKRNELLKDIGASNYEYCLGKYGSWKDIINSVLKSVNLITLSEAERCAWNMHYQQNGNLSKGDFEKIVGADYVELYLSYYGSWDSFCKNVLIDIERIDLLREIVLHCGRDYKKAYCRVPTCGELAKVLSTYHWEKYKRIYGNDRNTFMKQLMQATDKERIFEAQHWTEKFYIGKYYDFLYEFKREPNMNIFLKYVKKRGKEKYSVKRITCEINNYFGSWKRFVDCTRLEQEEY